MFITKEILVLLYHWRNTFKDCAFPLCYPIFCCRASWKQLYTKWKKKGIDELTKATVCFLWKKVKRGIICPMWKRFKRALGAKEENVLVIARREVDSFYERSHERKREDSAYEGEEEGEESEYVGRRRNSLSMADGEEEEEDIKSEVELAESLEARTTDTQVL
jgi:hypothetical protein